MLITLFTPTFNRADKLHRVYDSILKQTLQKVDGEYIFEWIIIDDGSMDATKELIAKWQRESDFPIYYHYQSNQGKHAASRKAIELAQGELFLFCDSDDAFLEETFETFYTVWQGFSSEERDRCGGIGVLCQDQFGNRVGCDYPIQKQLIQTLEIFFKWRDIPLGETWAALKTENLKKAFVIPKEAEGLKFIPESFFWSRITFELRPYSYFVNKVLRIYYKNEGDNISNNIREKYPEGFLFESKWFVTQYSWVLHQDIKSYIKYMVKYIIYSKIVQKSMPKICQELPKGFPRFLFFLLYLPSLLYQRDT
jgi:glycosyltransferase involved in cell wall biosynthesis